MSAGDRFTHGTSARTPRQVFTARHRKAGSQLTPDSMNTNFNAENFTNTVPGPNIAAFNELYSTQGVAGGIWKNLNVGWYYNWNLNEVSTPDLEYVPIRAKRWCYLPASRADPSRSRVRVRTGLAATG